MFKLIIGLVTKIHSILLNKRLDANNFKIININLKRRYSNFKKILEQKILSFGVK